MTDVFPKKVLFLVNAATGFLSHRMPIARAIRKAKYEVAVLGPRDSKSADKIMDKYIDYYPTDIDRKSVNPFKEFKTLRKINYFYRIYMPDICIHSTIKSVIYGGIAARINKVPKYVSIITGLGYVFIQDSFKVRVLRKIVIFLYRIAFNSENACLVFQNQDDLEYFKKNKIITGNKYTIIKGSGININLFKPVEKSEDIIRIALVSRMLWDKGIAEFVEAATIISQKNLKIKTEFLLVGGVDDGNPAAISKEQLEEWNKAGHVKWLGQQDDIVKIYEQSHIACLPSYREGLPRSLIEAAAAGLPLVATDVPGCREVVEEGINGFLVPAKDAKSLSTILLSLITEPEVRKSLGQMSRKKAEFEFSEEVIGKQMVEFIAADC